MNTEDLHPSVEQLSDHAEGLLADDEAVRVAAHILDCPNCQDTLAALTEVRDLLAADDPGRMPAEVADRLEAVLAAETDRDSEAAAIAAGAATPATAPAAPVSDLDARRRVRAQKWMKYGSAAAAVVLVGAGSVLGIAALQSQDGADTAAQAPFSAESLPDAASGALAAPVEITVSGREYTAAKFPDSVRLLTRASVSGTASGRQRVEELYNADQRAAQTATPPDDLDRCAALVASHAGSTVLAADLGRWRGTAALVVVVADVGHQDRVIGYVVPPGCAAEPSEPLRVLHRAVVPR